MPSPLQSDPRTPDDWAPSLEQRLWGLGMALGMVFLITVLSVTFPPRLFDAQWQLLLSSTLVNNGSIAVVGVLLLRLAMGLDERDELSSQWRRRMMGLRRACLALVLLFVLLVPLQISAAWSSVRVANTTQAQQVLRSSQQVESLKQALTTAGSAEEIDGKLRESSGGVFGLTSAERTLPLAELRKDLLRRVDVMAGQVQRQSQAQSRARRQSDIPIRESLRITLSALAYAYGFLLLGGLRLPRFRFRPPVRPEEEDYLEELMRP